MGKQFRRGPINLSEDRVEKLVLIAEAFERFASKKMERRARLKGAIRPQKHQI